MKTTGFLVRTAVVAALYAALTLVFAPISFGPIQFRVSECLTLLPLLTPAAIPGLFIGCFLANIASGIMDMIIGGLASLVAAILTRLLKKWYLGVIPPVVVNALLVPIIFLFAAGNGFFDISFAPDAAGPYYINVLTVGAGQLLSVCALGIPVYFGLKKANEKVKLF